MFFLALILMFSVEGLSLLAFNFPGLSLPLLIVAGVATLYMAFRKPDWGIYILFGELFFGSRGHLLEYDLGFVSISLRLVIFCVIFLVWIVSLPRHGEGLRERSLPKSYWLLLIVITFGIINGYFSGNRLANIFNDANGYLYLLILPAVLTAIKTREQVENILQILAAAIVVIAAKTLGLFLWFSFGWPGVAAAYHWIITQDFGEITGEVGSASRIFMQSQFYSLVGIFIFSFFTPPLVPPPQGEGNKKENSSTLPFGLEFMAERMGEARWGWMIWIIIASALLSLIMSLSRSFWLGAAAGGLFAMVIVLWRFRPYLKSFFGLGLRLGAIVILEIAFLYGVIMVGGSGVAEAVSSRGTNPAQEAAGSARLLLLPELVEGIKKAPILGSGFGTTVTYKSFLPNRITPENPDGEVTTFAFEWGYFDIILKVGLVGLVVYLLFIARIFRLGWVNMEYGIWNMGLNAGLAALLILNITTPYLNHPLGIGYLIFVYSYLFVIRKTNESLS